MKRNKMFSLILLVTMFFSLYTQSEVAAEDSAATFDVVDFKYCNADGTVITDFTNFTANQVVKAQATVKNNGASAGDITLILLAYQNGKLIKYDDSAAMGDNVASGTTAPLEASITLPTDPTGCTLYAYMWEDLTTMEALSNPAEFGSDNAEIETLLINGKKIEFDADGNATAELPVNTPSNPPFEIVTKDLSTTYTHEYIGVDKLIITTTSSGGNSKTYTVNYTIRKPKITGIKYNNTNLVVTSVMRQPDASITDAASDKTKTFATIAGRNTADISALGTTAVADRKGSYFINIPETYVGYNVIAGGTEPRSGNQPASFEVTVNCDTEIYYTASATANGIECTTVPSVVITPEATTESALQIVNVPNDDWWNGRPLSDYLPGRIYSMANAVLYKAVLPLPAGADTATYVINGVTCADYFPAFMLYKYVGYTPEGGETPPSGGGETPPPVEPEPVVGEITNIMYNGVLENALTSVMRQPDASLTSAGDTTKTLAAITGSDTVDISALATPAVADRKGSYFHTIPDAYVGYNVIVGENDTSGTGNTAQTFTITINAPTEIYYTANNSTNAVTCDSDNGVTITPERIEEYGFSAINVPDGWWTSTALSNYLSSRKYDMSGCRIFKATLTVPQGSATATYTVNCVNPATWFPAFMMYKFVNN